MTTVTVSRMVNRAEFTVDWSSYRKQRRALRKLREEQQALGGFTMGSARRGRNNSEAGSNSSGANRQDRTNRDIERDVIRRAIDSRRRATDIRVAENRVTEALTYSTRTTLGQQDQYREEMARITRQYRTTNQNTREYNMAMSNLTRRIRQTDVATGRNQRNSGTRNDRIGNARLDASFRLREAGNLDRLNPALLADYSRRYDRLIGQFERGEISANRMNRLMSQMNTELRRANRETSNWYSNLGRARRMMVGLSAAGGALWVGKSIVETGKQFDAATIGMGAVFGEEAAEQINYLSNITAEFGIRTKSMVKDYVQFGAAATASKMPLDDQRIAFEGLMQASSVFHLSQDAVRRSMKAINQSLSKGTVQAEEFKNQFGK